MTPVELDTMARTVWAEARGEPLAGQIAVAWVILNRARNPGADWWGDDIVSVCRRPWQFSCWNKGDPNRARLLALTLANRHFQVAQAACLLAASGQAPDPTGGATHYHTVTRPRWLAADKPWPPVWADGLAETITIGAHTFYKETSP